MWVNPGVGVSTPGGEPPRAERGWLSRTACGEVGASLPAGGVRSSMGFGL